MERQGALRLRDCDDFGRHPRFFRYDLPIVARGEILVVESLEEADDTADRGDQTSESLAADDGGEASYEGSRVCGKSKGLSGNAGLVQCPLGTRPFREGGGDIDFDCGDWKPNTWRFANSASVSWGDSALMASRNRCARAIRSAFGAAMAEPGITGDCKGDMIGVSGGVAKPTEGCIEVAAVATETVAMT